MFDLSVKYLHNEETRNYSLDDSGSVYNLKEKISNDLDIPIRLITLKTNTDELSDDDVLSSLDCSNCPFIVVIKDLISISIKTNLEMFDSANNYLTFLLKSEKIIKLKERLSKSLSIATQIISLRFKDEVLENSKTFIDYNIHEDSELIFGLNVFILEQDKNDNMKFNVINEFVDRNISVSELIENYCCEKKLNKDLIKFNYENSVLTNENVVDLIKTSANPTFRVSQAARISFKVNENNVFETYLFHDETILKLRNRIKSKIDTFEGNEILLYEDKLLVDSQVLQFYGKKNCYQVFSGFELLMNSEDIQIIPPVFVHNRMSIKNTRLRFAENLHIEWLFINLLIADEKLDDSKTIEYYGITETTCIDLKIGISILIFHSEDVIEYIVKPDTAFHDIKLYVSYKYQIDLDNIKLMIDDKEVKPNENLVEIVKSKSDVIITVKSKLTICIFDENGSRYSHQIWDKSRISQLKELISANTRILKESILLKIGTKELDDEKTIEFYNINEKSEIQMLIQNRVTIIDEQENMHYVIIEPTDSILSLRKLLTLKVKQDLSEINLYQDGILLEDNRSLHSYNINFNSLLLVKLGILIRLVDERNNKYEFVLSKISTIGRLKDLLITDHNFKIDKFNLIYNEMKLTDDLFIESFKFEKDSTIKIVTESIPDLISIYVCNLTDEFSDFSIISVVINTDSTIKSIKEHILENHNVDLDGFILTFLGEKLDEKLYFCEYSIAKNNSLMLKSKTQNCCGVTPMGIIINVKHVFQNNEESPKFYKFLFDDYQNISILKQKLRDELNVSVNSIKLIYEQKELIDSDTIRSLDLDNDSTIVMVVKNQEIQENKNSVKVNIKFSFLEGNSENFKEQEINQTEMVSTLKQQISNDFNLQPNSFVLAYNEEIMVDKNFLSIYELVDGSKIVVCRSVFVKSLSGQSLDTSTVRRFPIELNDTISVLLKRIGRKLNIQTDFIKLHFQGEYLNEETLVKNTEIENESFLMMITTLKGG